MKPDIIKYQLAQAMKNHVASHAHDNGESLGVSYIEDVKYVEGSNLTASLYIKTEHQGMRCFTFTLRETF